MTSNSDFSYQILSSKNAAAIFPILLNVKNWWTGVFDEIIEGDSSNIGDEFTFSAGDGAHFSRQKLIEKIDGKKITWQVIESQLSFLKNKNEWDNTTISFDLEAIENGTKITFSHKGLTPKIECYANCSSAWMQYLKNLNLLLK